MKKYALALVPLLLGLFLMWAAQSGQLADPILFIRVNLGLFVLFIGLLTSGVLLTVFLVRAWGERRASAALVGSNNQQEDLRRQFIRRLDHEMKNPLTALRAALANLNGREDSEVVASLHSQVDRLARLTTDLRKLTDLETQPIECEQVDISELLAELIEEAQNRVEMENRQMHLSLPQVPWPLPPVSGDRDLLYIACHNLMENALKFSDPEAAIEVRAFEDGPLIAVEVAGTGTGIPSGELPHIGEELYRGRAALGVEGSGMGLALVRAIVARHDGTMSVRSRPGIGTVVTLRFPAASAK
ncbi:MAG: HAMP domain-containing histidine kinase [Chloroflexi bacterium]|nr:HAMP domain-containing histidine kinase [Chloroflexota bacterium]